MRVLVSGSQGFVGSALVPALRAAGHEVAELEGDVRDERCWGKALEKARPAAVFHLAGISHVPTCEKDPAAARDVNVGGTAALLDALKRGAPARIVLFSSAQVYAPSQGDAPLDESAPLAPQNAYARTKREAEQLVEAAVARGDATGLVLRLFNHTHRGQSPEFFLPHVYRQLVEAAGDVVEIPVGNVELRRDIGSIQDLLALLLAATKAAPGLAPFEVLNACSGKPKQLRRLIEGLGEALGKRPVLHVVPERVRAGEPECLVGSPLRAEAALGWAPTCLSEADLVRAFLA